MNAKKTFIATLASLTAIASLTAVSAGAVAPGASDGSVVTVAIDVQAGQPATGTLAVNDNEITVTIPADAVTGAVNFNAAVKVDVDAQAALDSLEGVTVSASEILDLYFTDENGEVVDMAGKNVEVAVKTDKYNTAYLFKDKALTDLGAKAEDGTLTFTAPHFSTYVLANVTADAPTSTPATDNSTPATDNSTPATDNGTTNTGDNSFATTIAIFSIMAVVSLGTAVVATKAKKKSSK